MVKIDASELPLIVEACLIWTGFGRTATPQRDDSSLRTRFGNESASRLQTILKSLENEFYQSDAWKMATDLREMGELAGRDFKSKHPEVPDEIVQALKWCYTYDYK